MDEAATDRNVIDLFSGPGGWCVGAARLGLRPLGVEWDDAACATRRAAGLPTLQGDVAKLDPRTVLTEHFGANAVLDGLIASPPCQDFSMAGKGAGRDLVPDLAVLARSMVTGRWTEDALQAQAVLTDGAPRALLVLEPVKWLKMLDPTWVALEQVPAVLPIWEAIAEGLREVGYSAWAGLLSAERYGVPQTRTRAILLASTEREVGEPPATHARYVAPRKEPEGMDSLFGDDTPARERIVLPEDRDLLPWISMAEALGWAMTDRPSFTVSAGGAATGGPEVWSSTSRAAMADERDSGRWIVDTGNTRSGTRKEGRARSVNAPAPVVTSRADQLEWRDDEPDTAPFPTHYDRRQTGGDGTPVKPRATTKPAPTITAVGVAGRDVWTRSEQPLAAAWTGDRPATTVAADPRIPPPGYRGGKAEYAELKDGEKPARSGDNAIRVSEEEAAALQSFPAGYPWQGTKSKRFEQIGNAVPPLLAFAVLRVAVGAELPVAA